MAMTEVVVGAVGADTTKLAVPISIVWIVMIVMDTVVGIAAIDCLKKAGAVQVSLKKE